MKKKSNAGRPTVMTEQTVEKLLYAFSCSYTDQEACLYAWINKATLYNYCEKNPWFIDQKEALKKQPNMLAKNNWLSKIKDGDYTASKDWLERKAKDEFSLKQELEQTGDLNINVISYKDA